MVDVVCNMPVGHDDRCPWPHRDGPVAVVLGAVTGVLAELGAAEGLGLAGAMLAVPVTHLPGLTLRVPAVQVWAAADAAQRAGLGMLAEAIRAAAALAGIPAGEAGHG